MNIRKRFMKEPVPGILLLIALISSTAPNVFGQRTRIDPAWSLFSVQQDIELGRQVAQDAEKQLPMLNNKRVDDYLKRLGLKLAGYAPGDKYPYQFKCVNDSGINAFALPGGFLFINRGVIENADNEAELAGVIGHEIGHVALRHGTNQASKSQLAQFPLAIIGGLFDKDSVAALLTQLGAGFAVNSVLLKYSRDAERQADIVGTQILFDANYDPNYMAKFFEKLDSGGRGTDFFSSHPNPDNRMEKIRAEIARLGRRSGTRVNNSSEFDSIQKLVESLPPAPKANTDAKQPTAGEGASRPPASAPERSGPPAPSSRFRGFYSEYVRLKYPENWRVFGHDRDFSLTPEGGILRNSGDSFIAYGVSVTISEIPDNGRAATGLEEATARLMEKLRQSNPSMKLVRNQGRTRIDGKPGLSAIYRSDSPLGGNEIDWVVTVMRPEGLTALIFIAPEGVYDGYERTFEKILDSVDFTGR
jgi:hypothetical protein